MERELPEFPPEGDRTAEFTRHRRLLFSIAYRMLGSVADAEDLVQETCVRWLHVPASEVRAPRAFLVTVLSRLCINHLESARVRREVSVGQSLPEPLLTDRDDDPLGVLRVDESLSMALLLLLERLTPVERAVFLLREVFGFTYAEIAASLGQREANCRQLLHRARTHVGDMKRRFVTSAAEHRALLERFVAAARDGDVAALMSLLADDVALHIDRGSVTPVPNVVRGKEKVARGLLGGARSLPPDVVTRLTTINGDAGMVTYSEGRPWSALALDIRGEHIAAIYIVADQNKLTRFPALHDRA